MKIHTFILLYLQEDYKKYVATAELMFSKNAKRGLSR
jgi:hypothetical protein